MSNPRHRSLFGRPFKAVVLHPDLRPALLDADALAFIPDRVKRQ